MGQGEFETPGYIRCGREEGGNVEVFGTEAMLSGGRGSQFSSGCRRLSRTSTVGKRAITIVLKSVGLPSFGIGILIVCFQMVGMLQWLCERL